MLRAPFKSPRLRTARCTAGGAPRSSPLTRSSTSLSLMNASISRTLGNPITCAFVEFALPAPSSPPPAFASCMRASREAEESPCKSPQEITDLLIVGEQDRNCFAASRPTRFRERNSSTSLLLRRPMPTPAGAVAWPSLASRMRTSNAAEGFRALFRSPRCSTWRCTSLVHSRKSSAARSSILLRESQSSTSL